MALKKGQWMCGECHRVNENRFEVCYSCGKSRHICEVKPLEETGIEYTALRHEVKLNRKETMIAFKRLVDVELRLEAIENKLRG